MVAPVYTPVDRMPPSAMTRPMRAPSLRPAVPAHLSFVEGGGMALQSSRRRVDLWVAYATMYEFEDVIAAVTGADRIEAIDADIETAYRRLYRVVRKLSGSPRLARSLSAPPALTLMRDYDLFFPVFNTPYELFGLASLPNWRQRCGKAACFVMEYWTHQFNPDYLLELLAPFDHIFVGTLNSVDKIAAVTGRPCSFLPPAADVLRFSPLPKPPDRHIDVLNLGRRSEITHEALLEMAGKRQIHYFHDTVAPSGANKMQRSFCVDDPAAHRQLLAAHLQRSRYFVANRARANEAEYAQHLDEISYRFYEGAAAGVVMIGEAPRTENFRKQFDWEDAVFHVPFNAPDIAERLAALDADPARMAAARRRNLHQSALRHDWVHRIRRVFEVLDLKPTDAMRAREARLAELAQMALDAPEGSI